MKKELHINKAGIVSMLALTLVLPSCNKQISTSLPAPVKASASAANSKEAEPARVQLYKPWNKLYPEWPTALKMQVNRLYGIKEGC